ncbi:MAG: VanZ family protein [Thermodesulfobacteriota bacterium]
MHPADTHPFKRFTYYWLPVFLYCLIIFIQSSFPASEHVPDFDFSDKLLHVAAYAVLGLFLYRAFNAMDKRISPIRLVALSIFLTALYGASDEIHQYFVPSRSAELLDFMADFIGSILGVLAAVALYKNKHKV